MWRSVCRALFACTLLLMLLRVAAEQPEAQRKAPQRTVEFKFGAQDSDSPPDDSAGDDGDVGMCGGPDGMAGGGPAGEFRQPASVISVMGRDLVWDMFNHAWNAYEDYAYGADELKPVTCGRSDHMGGLMTTMVDALDTMVLIRHPHFAEHAQHVCDNFVAERDAHVSVFETNIRIVGGFLGAHFSIEEGLADMPGYNGCFLVHAARVAELLLPAFDTPTGIPYGSLNLKKGVAKGETFRTHTASGGTFLLEFIVLSAMTGDHRYEAAARKATVALFTHRDPVTNLLGSEINIATGEWTDPTSLLGVSFDSFVEYLLKAYVLTGDLTYFDMFETCRAALELVRNGPHFSEQSHMSTGQPLRTIHSSLANFYPGLLTLAGRLQDAESMIMAQHSVFLRYGAFPEGLGADGEPHPGQESYPLRPEHAESIYLLYRATGDDRYIRMGYEVAVAINTRCRVRCGFAAVSDVAEDVRRLRKPWDDRMDSFFLAETLKYLYLLFDSGNPIHGEGAAATTDTIVDQVRAGWRHRSDPAPATTQRDMAIDESAELAAVQRAAAKAQHRHADKGYAAVPVDRPGTGRAWVFNTEGHIIPVSTEWSQYVEWASRQPPPPPTPGQVRSKAPAPRRAKGRRTSWELPRFPSFRRLPRV